MDLSDNLKTLRRKLHSFPETAGNEKATAQAIVDFLSPLAPDKLTTGLGGHGILALYDSGLPGPEVLIRAELDALAIKEINDFDHRSRNEGKGHQCGHDGHMAILCGVAQEFSKQPPRQGKAYLLFQPAEENGEGAEAVLNDSAFSIAPDFVFALHNLPGFPLRSIVVKDDTFTAAVESMILKLNGKTSHAAEPEHGLNPAKAIAEIIEAGLNFDNNHPDHEDMAVVTPVYITLGSKDYGISAGYAEVHFTIRCWDDERLKDLEGQIINRALYIAKNYKLNLEVEYTQCFHANMNHRIATDHVRTAAKDNNFHLVEKKYPFKWGEDFGSFTSRFKGAMFGLGAGEDCPALHNPDYDFPDEIISTGVKMFHSIIHNILSEEQDV